jgi:hypothetical protein
MESDPQQLQRKRHIGKMKGLSIHFLPTILIAHVLSSVGFNFQFRLFVFTHPFFTRAVGLALFFNNRIGGRSDIYNDTYKLHLHLHDSTA